MYRVPNYPTTLRAKHPDGFAILDAALKLGDNFMAATQGKPVSTAKSPKRYRRNRVVAALFARLYNLLGAATMLLEEGYGIEAGALTRSFIESFFDICYIANQRQADADNLAQRLIDHQYVAHYLTVKHAKEAGMTLKPKEYQLAEQERQKRWDKKYGWGKGAYSQDWSGLRAQEKARAGGAEDIYLWLNHHFSRMVHGGPDVLRHLVIEEELSTAYRIGPQDLLIDLPIPALGLLFCVAVGAIAKLAKLSDIQTKADETYRFIEVKARAMVIEV